MLVTRRHGRKEPLLEDLPAIDRIVETLIMSF